MRDAFPDFTETIEDVVDEADRVVTRFTSTGTHLGALRGLAPTGRRIWMAEMAIFRVARGRIRVMGTLRSTRHGPAARNHAAGVTAWPPMELSCTRFTMDVDLQDAGATPSGRRRIVVVKNGSFSGPRLRDPRLARTSRGVSDQGLCRACAVRETEWRRGNSYGLAG